MDEINDNPSRRTEIRDCLKAWMSLGDHCGKPAMPTPSYPLTLLLYTTEGCHLCEQAEALLQTVDVAVKRVDIADDDGLFHRYGTRIPVLQRSDTGQELAWPFDDAAVGRFLVGSK